jgi:hypothetical protein
VAAAGVGLLAAAALAAALVEWVQKAPAAPAAAAEDAPLRRPDPVRALAIEHGLLGTEPAFGEAAEALPFEPAANAAPPPEPAPAAPASP